MELNILILVKHVLSKQTTQLKGHHRFPELQIDIFKCQCAARVYI